jgi:hypothetical protein
MNQLPTSILQVIYQLTQGSATFDASFLHLVELRFYSSRYRQPGSFTVGRE